MDDIQLCKDIMSLKQELRQIVAVPGKVQTLRRTKLLTSAKTEGGKKKSAAERKSVNTTLEIDCRNVKSVPQFHNPPPSRRHGDL